MDNERKFIREFTSSNIKFFDNEGKLVHKGKVRDISAGGILAVSYDFNGFKTLDDGDEVIFTLSIPTGDVTGVAEVVWSDPGQSSMGLKFARFLDKESVSNLMAFVADGFLSLK